MSMQRWDGTAWVDATARRWDGTAWAAVTIARRWDGTAWVDMLPPRPAADAFDRTVTGGWGVADTGQSWTTTGGDSSDYSVQGV